MSSSNRAPQLRASLLAGALSAIAIAASAGAATDLAELQVAPQRGQSAEQARRDRYECHNWAVEQTGVVPQAAPAEDEADNDQRARRAERIDRVLRGAAIGAGIGGLVRSVQRKNPSNGVLAGAAVGAAVGASTVRTQGESVEDEESNEYLRALSACLEGRGYSVAAPAADDTTEVVAAR
jgi:hypothetical protein